MSQSEQTPSLPFTSLPNPRMSKTSSLVHIVSEKIKDESHSLHDVRRTNSPATVDSPSYAALDLDDSRKAIEKQKKKVEEKRRKKEQKETKQDVKKKKRKSSRQASDELLSTTSSDHSSGELDTSSPSSRPRSARNSAKLSTDFQQWISNINPKATNPDEVLEEYEDDDEISDDSSMTSSFSEKAATKKAVSAGATANSSPGGSNEEISGKEGVLNFTDPDSFSDAEEEEFLPPKKTNKVFHKRFKELTEEIAINAFLCALLVRGKLLLQGSMYITRNYVCFYSKIITKTMVAIRFVDVTSVEKAKILGSIPNSIEICTQHKKYFWASFLHRDKAFSMIMDRWRATKEGCLNSSAPSPSGGQHGSTNSNSNSIASSNNNSSSSSNEDTRLELGDDSLKMRESSPDLKAISGKMTTSTSSFTPNLSKASQNQIDVKRHAFKLNSHISMLSNEEIQAVIRPPVTVNCFHEKELSNVKVTYKQVFPLSVHDFYLHFISDMGNSFWEEFHAKYDYKEFEMSHWKTSDDKCCIERTTQFKAPKKVGIVTKYTRVIQEQRCRYDKDNLIFETNTISKDVPYSSNFLVHAKWVFSPISESSSELEINTQVLFSGGKNLIKSIIERQAIDGCKDWFEYWVSNSLAVSDLLHQNNKKPRNQRTPKRELLRESMKIPLSSIKPIIERFDQSTDYSPSLEDRKKSISDGIDLINSGRSSGVSGRANSSEEQGSLDRNKNGQYEYSNDVANEQTDNNKAFAENYLQKYANFVQNQLEPKLLILGTIVVLALIIILSLCTLYFSSSSSSLERRFGILSQENKNLEEQIQFIRSIAAKAAGKKPLDDTLEHWRFWQEQGLLDTIIERWKESATTLVSEANKLADQLRTFNLPRPKGGDPKSDFYQELEQYFLAKTK